jgi:uncharacterized protein (DUF849 family)
VRLGGMSIIQVTPNGPYGKDVHPAMPETLQELLVELGGCFLCGAGGVHLHVRDDDGRESLDPGHVNPTVEAVRNVAGECGAHVEVGLTTGAWIVPDLSERIGLIRDWVGVDCATVNLSEEGFEEVMAGMLDVGIGIDVGLWDISEVPALTASGLLDQVTRISIELDPGEPYFPKGDPVELAGAINDALDEAGSTCPRLTHGAGDWTWPLVRDALRRGHDTRVGFEDSTRMPDGSVAASNRELVKAAVATMNRPS